MTIESSVNFSLIICLINCKETTSRGLWHRHWMLNKTRKAHVFSAEAEGQDRFALSPRRPKICTNENDWLERQISRVKTPTLVTRGCRALSWNKTYCIAACVSDTRGYILILCCRTKPKYSNSRNRNFTGEAKNELCALYTIWNSECSCFCY